MSNYWVDRAAALRGSLAGKGQEFIASASLEEIEAAADPAFAALGENTKTAVIAVMRAQVDPFVAWPLADAEVMGAFAEDSLSESDAVGSLTDPFLSPAEAMAAQHTAHAS